MTLENIYYIGQTIAVIVIVLTLFAILWQGLQTNKIARADLTQSLWVQAGAANYSMMDSPEKADFMHRALYSAAPLTEPEKLRFANLMGYVVGMHEGAYMLRGRGLVEAAAYERTSGIMRLYFQSPRVRKWWRARREYGYEPAFQSMIDKLSRDQEAGNPAPPPLPEQPA